MHMREAHEREQERTKKLEVVAQAAWRLRCSAAQGSIGNVHAWEALYLALDDLARFDRMGE